MLTILLVCHTWPTPTNRGPAVVTENLIFSRTYGRKSTVTDNAHSHLAQYEVTVGPALRVASHRGTRSHSKVRGYLEACNISKCTKQSKASKRLELLGGPCDTLRELEK